MPFGRLLAAPGQQTQAITDTVIADLVVTDVVAARAGLSVAMWSRGAALIRSLLVRVITDQAIADASIGCR